MMNYPSLHISDHPVPLAIRVQLSVFAVSRQTYLVVETDRRRQQS